jgi:penicillin-binding protein 1B
MKKAVALPQYSDVKPFRQPDGVVDVQLDKVTNRLATPSCPDDYTIAFVAGTEPHDSCDQASTQGFFSRIFGGTSEKALPPPSTNGPTSVATTNGNPEPDSGVKNGEEPKKKKGFFSKIADAFKGDSGRDKKDDDKNTPAESKPAANGTTPP